MPKKVSEKLEVKTTEETVQLIVFDLAYEEYGVSINDIKEIIRTGEITQIPDSPEFIAGVINVRGNIIPVLDLSEMFLFDMKGEEESKHIIVTEQGENTFGLMVDEVTEVLRVEVGEIKSAPKVIKSKMHGDYLKGVVPLKDRLVTLLDFQKMLSDEEFARLDELTKEHRRKIKFKKKEEKTEEKPSESKGETQIEKPKKESTSSEEEAEKEKKIKPSLIDNKNQPDEVE